RVDVTVELDVRGRVAEDSGAQRVEVRVDEGALVVGERGAAVVGRGVAPIRRRSAHVGPSTVDTIADRAARRDTQHAGSEGTHRTTMAPRPDDVARKIGAAPRKIYGPSGGIVFRSSSLSVTGRN